MQIVFVSTHATAGGTQEFIDDISAELRAKDFSVSSIALFRGKDLASSADSKMEILIDVAFSSWSDRLRSLLQLARRLKESKATAVVAVMPAAAACAGVAAIFARVPRRISTLHTPSSAFSPGVRRLDRLMGATGFYTEIIAVSESVHRSFSHYPTSYTRRLRTILTGIRLPPKIIRACTVRGDLGVPSDAHLFAMIGRVSHEKNVLRAIEAVGAVERAYLVIVGDGPLLNDARELALKIGANDRIKFTGRVAREQAINILYAANTFLQPSLFEGRSLALLDAIGAGIPIIASNIAGQVEVLAYGSDRECAGILCDPTDLAAMRDVIREVTMNPQLCLALRARISSLRGRTPTFSKMADAYINVISGHQP